MTLAAEPGSGVAAAAEVVVVTGLSGAGKSTAVHALEDLGFFCVDNLPTPVLLETLRSIAGSGFSKVALGIDVRIRGFLDEAAPVLESLARDATRKLSIVYLDASDESLLRRFSSTRRPHPLSTQLSAAGEHTANAVLEGIHAERELLGPLRAQATVVIDTTRLSVHELRKRIVDHFAPGVGGIPRLRTRIVSFGFKFGAPVDADILLDVRFLDNPHFVEELGHLPGTDSRVRSFVLDKPQTQTLLTRIVALLEFCIPNFEREGKSYLTVGIGCTGGRHRSVVVTEELVLRLSEMLQMPMEVVHRDIERSGRA